MRRRYRYEDLHDDDFEELVNRICVRQLGTGTISFAPGRDGGRDGKFEGTAQKFPSEAQTLSGRFIIQAKWTSNPAASCADADFVRLIKDKELPRVEKLIEAGELDHYLLFTNRRKPAGSTLALQDEIRDLGMETAHVLGTEELDRFLDLAPDIWQSMGFARFDSPFTVSPTDLTEVVKSFHAALKSEPTVFDSSKNFTHVKVEKKNETNNLSDEYDRYIRENSLKYFTEIERFLRDPRNMVIQELYHDAADELKQKIVVNRGDFEKFDHVFTFVSDLVISGNEELVGKKRYVRTFLHYMYYDCDIGEHVEA